MKVNIKMGKEMALEKNIILRKENLQVILKMEKNLMESDITIIMKLNMI